MGVNNPGVPVTRQVIAGTNLTGGGPLNADVTLNASGGGGALELISRNSVLVATPTITFSAIPATYQDLILTVLGRSSQAAEFVEMRTQFNGDTGLNYQGTTGWNRFGVAAEGTNTSFKDGNFAANTATANSFSMIEMLISNYLSTVTNKHIWATTRTYVASLQDFIQIDYGTWNSTVAINQIDLSLSAGNFMIGSVVSLYGRG